MEVNMLDNGKIIKLMGKVYYIILMEMCMKVNGLMIRLVEKELININMGLNM
jgi:hypothetical protein